MFKQKLNEMNELVDMLKQKMDELEKLKISKDERYEIAEYLAQYFSQVSDEVQGGYNFMMKGKAIYEVHSYRDLLKSDKILPENVIVYVRNWHSFSFCPSVSNYLYPFLFDDYFLLMAYLSKLGVYNNFYDTAPATGLRYIAIVFNFEKIGRVVTEIADLDNVISNTDLHTIIQIHDISGEKDMTIDEVKKFLFQFKSKKLIAGHDFAKARRMIREYYKENSTELAEDVRTITEAYYKIFRPFRAVYDINTKQFIVK